MKIILYTIIIQMNLIKTPFIIWGKIMPSQKVDYYMGMIDIMPTIE